MARDDSSTTDEQSTDGVSRRRMLQGLSVGAAGALAGCGGDGGGDGDTTTTTADTTTATDTTTTAADTTTTSGDGDGDTTTTTEDTTTTTEDTTTTTEDPGESVVERIVLPQAFDAPPTDLHFNTWNQKQSTTGLWWSPLTRTHTGVTNSLYAPMGVGRVAEFEPDTGTLRYGVLDSKWWAPGPRYIDGEDLLTFIYCQIGVRTRQVYMNSRSIKVEDERTVVIKQREPQNPGFTRMDALKGRSARTSKENWGEWVDRVQGARKADNTWDDQELDAIANQMLTWRQPNAEGNSIYKIDAINPDAYVCSINEGHYMADKWNGVEEIRLTNQPNSDRRLQRFIEGDSWYWNQSLSEDLQSQVGDSAVKLTNFGSSQTGLGIQHRRNSTKHDSPSNENVPYNVPVLGMEMPWPRIALEFIIDRGALADNIGPDTISDGAPDDDIISGITAAEENFIYDDWKEYFPSYPVDHETAEGLLSKVEGLSKPSSGPWQYMESTWEPEFTTQNSGSRLTTGRVVTDQLQQFGIQAQNLVTDSGKLWGDLFANATMGHFPGATYGGWGIYPLEGLEVDAPNSGYGGRFGWHGASNMKGTAKIPPYPDDGGQNAFDPQELIDMSESDLQQINPPQLAERGIGTTDPETANRIINEMAWMYAFQLPFLPLAMGPSKGWFRVDDYDMVEPYDNPQEWRGGRMVLNHRNVTQANQALVESGLYEPIKE